MIIMLAAAGVVALAIVGCIVRTMLRWSRSTFAWASGTQKIHPNYNDKELEDGGAGGDDKGEGDDEGSAPMTRKASKFTRSPFVLAPPALPT
ncbi:hypothetical protein BGZ65_008889, partial [Modicella reniformis]